MCVLGTAVRDYCEGGATAACGEHVKLSPVNYQQIVVLLLTALALILTVKLVGKQTLVFMMTVKCVYW